MVCFIYLDLKIIYCLGHGLFFSDLRAFFLNLTESEKALYYLPNRKGHPEVRPRELRAAVLCNANPQKSGGISLS